MIEKLTEKHLDFYPSFRVVRLEATDENGATAAHATGFLIKEIDFLSLYTCWHFVTGIDPTSPPITYPPKRISIRVFAIAEEPLIADDGNTVIGSKIGNQKSLDIPLYHHDGSPAWIQQLDGDGSNPKIASIPVFDCVRIDVSNHARSFSFFFEPEDTKSDLTGVGDDCFIAGFPFGYSPMENTPSPTFLKRSQSSTMPFTGGVVLLDGPGASCMSGSPILIRREGRWMIAGLYLGVIFPEALRFSERLENDKDSKLPLGKFMPIGLVRAVLRVSHSPG